MKKKLLAILVAFAALAIPVGSASALSSDYFGSTDSTEPINHSIFVAEESVSNKENVNGIGFIAGKSVDLDGQYDYGFFAGSSVNITGTVKNDLFVAGGVITIDKNAVIGRDLYAAGDIINVKNDINGNAFITGNQVNLSGIKVNGDLKLAADTIVFNDATTVTGTISYNENAKVKGKEKLVAGAEETYKNDTKEAAKPNMFVVAGMSLAVAFVFACLVNLAFPKLYKKVAIDQKAKDVALTCLKGLVFTVATPIIAIVIMCTIVGIEFGVLAFLLYAVVLMLAGAVATMTVGYAVAKKFFKVKNSYLCILIGAILLGLISFIPIVGGIIYIIVAFYGVGAMWNLFKKERKN